MKITIIVANPNTTSFNHAIAQTAREIALTNGHEVYFHDLYAEHFDPIAISQELPKGGVVDEEIQRYCRELIESEGIIIVHPNWWGMPPAILKGWIDRVIRPGVAYEFQEQDSGEGVPVGLLKLKAALVFNTSNTFPDRETRVFGDPLERIWKDCVFGLCGVNNVHRTTYSVVVVSSLEQRKQWLEDVKTQVSKHFPKS